MHERAIRAAPIEFIDGAPGDRPLTRIPEYYLDAGGEFLVGLVDDTIVAIGGFLHEDGRTCRLRHLRVDPAHQRQGYATQLLTELETRARSRGIEEAMLQTNERLVAARQLYEENGYEETAREMHSDTEHVFVQYRKRLD